MVVEREAAVSEEERPGRWGGAVHRLDHHTKQQVAVGEGGQGVADERDGRVVIGQEAIAKEGQGLFEAFGEGCDGRGQQAHHVGRSVGSVVRAVALLFPE